MAIFPENILNQETLTIDNIIAKMSYFFEQTHLYHLQTYSHAEHKALNELYDGLLDFKDEIAEKLMGYSGRRIKAYKIEPLQEYADGCSIKLTSDIIAFAKKLETFGTMNDMPDINNIAQSLSGLASQKKYLLTMR